MAVRQYASVMAILLTASTRVSARCVEGAEAGA